jgi:hypothetical protein
MTITAPSDDDTPCPRRSGGVVVPAYIDDQLVLFEAMDRPQAEALLEKVVEDMILDGTLPREALGAYSPQRRRRRTSS